MTAGGPLRLVVLNETGQDVRKCVHCEFCNTRLFPEQDVSLETLLQMVLMNDDEVLTTRTLWSDHVLKFARHACASHLDMEAVLLCLRNEARRRGVSREAEN